MDLTYLKKVQSSYYVLQSFYSVLCFIYLFGCSSSVQLSSYFHKEVILIFLHTVSFEPGISEDFHWTICILCIVLYWSESFFKSSWMLANIYWIHALPFLSWSLFISCSIHHYLVGSWRAEGVFTISIFVHHSYSPVADFHPSCLLYSISPLQPWSFCLSFAIKKRCLTLFCRSTPTTWLTHLSLLPLSLNSGYLVELTM